VEERIRQVTHAWETLRPQKSFGGMTLDQFKTKVKPSLDARGDLADLESQWTAKAIQRDAADLISSEAILLVVNSVKGDPEEGEDGELYETMGYVRRSERKSGLTRKSKVQPAPSG
jgi:hypothetical protein